MRIPFRSAGAVGAAHGSAAAAAGPVDRGNTGGDDKSYQTVQRPNPHIDISPTSQVTGPRIESSANEWIQNLNHLNAMRAAQQGTKFNPYQGGSRPQGGLLNPMGVMSLLGGFMKKPFSLAATGFNSLRDTLGTGINAVRNKFGPAWNDWTDADNLEEFLRRRRTGETITNPAVRGEYGLPAINIEEEPNYIENFTSNNQNLKGIDQQTAFLEPWSIMNLLKSGITAEGVGKALLQQKIKDEALEKIKESVSTR